VSDEERVGGREGRREGGGATCTYLDGVITVLTLGGPVDAAVEVPLREGGREGGGEE